MLFSKDSSDEGSKTGLTGKIELDEDLAKSFYAIHKTMENKYLTPKRFLVLLETYRQVYLSKQQTVGKRQQHLKSGVSKLSDARKVVDDLKRNAEIKQKELAVKQHEADDALKQITKSMAVSEIVPREPMAKVVGFCRTREARRPKWNNWRSK